MHSARSNSYVSLIGLNLFELSSIKRNTMKLPVCCGAQNEIQFSGVTSPNFDVCLRFALQILPECFDIMAQLEHCLCQTFFCTWWHPPRTHAPTSDQPIIDSPITHQPHHPQRLLQAGGWILCLQLPHRSPSLRARLAGPSKRHLRMRMMKFSDPN